MARTLDSGTAATAAPKPGHNMPPELIQQWFGEIVQLDDDYQKAHEEAKTAKSTLASKYKLFEKAGGNIKSMKKLVKERNEDRAQIALDKAAEEAYRDALNMVIRFGDLVTAAEHASAAAHTNSSDDADHAKLDSAHDKGLSAAKNGTKREDNPYPFESDEWDAWNKGWDQAAMDAVSGKGGQAGNGSTRRRSSRAKGGNAAGATAH